MHAAAILAISSLLPAQIPEHARWEVTFAQVEAAADLPDMRTSPPVPIEIRVVERAWGGIQSTYVQLIPFLRLVQADGVIRPELFVFWTAKGAAPDRQPQGADVRCRDGVCVKPIAVQGELDWEKVVRDLADGTACPNTIPAGLVSVCADCPTLWIKTSSVGVYREATCENPAPATTARALLELMRGSAGATR